MEKHPDFISVNRIGGKTHTNGMVTVDYLQNAISRSMVAPYSLRAHPKATVSTPLTWSEVEKGAFLPTDFTLKTVPNRIAEKGDVFAGVLTEKQELDI
jgi:bifunctional non-homologous end joining protein LigD